MDSELDDLAQEAHQAIGAAQSQEELEQLRAAYLGRSSRLRAIFESLGQLAVERRREVAAPANRLRQELERELESRHNQIQDALDQSLGQTEMMDLTAPARPLGQGRLHLVTQIEREVVEVLARLGYSVVYGPELETDYYNFEALNIPKGHPARDTQDSFYFSDDQLLRSQTSPVQIHTMENTRPPIRVIAPGRCFRRENLDATHLASFYQVEGLAVDVGIDVSHLKGTLQYFAEAIFGGERRIRLRPDYFPFTEPSFEVAVSCGLCGGSGCRGCGGSGWLEIMGAGMVHPAVLRRGGIDPTVHSGFAFGMGLERIAMLKHHLDDIRLLYENDLRFVLQF